MLNDSTIPLPTLPCPTCNGTGVEHYTPQAFHDDYDERECVACEGEGWVLDVEAEDARIDAEVAA